MNRTNSDEILKGLLTEMKEEKENFREMGEVKELRMPKHQKEIIKDLVIVNRYE